MISNELFKETESRLYSYYKMLKEIDKLEHKCDVLEQQKEKIRMDIKNTNVTIDPEISSVNYSMERVQVSHSGTSYAEAAVIKEITRLEDEWTNTKKQVLKLHAKIRDIKCQIADVEYSISILSDTYKSFVVFKYRDGKALEYIGNEMHMSKSTAFKLKNNVIDTIGKALYCKLA